MEAATLACPIFRVNGIAAGISGDKLTPSPPSGTFTPPHPLGVVPVEADEEIDIVDLAVLSVFALGCCSQLLLLIRLTSKILSVGTSCSNFIVDFSL